MLIMLNRVIRITTLFFIAYIILLKHIQVKPKSVISTIGILIFYLKRYIVIGNERFYSRKHKRFIYRTYYCFYNNYVNRAKSFYRCFFYILYRSNIMDYCFYY